MMAAITVAAMMVVCVGAVAFDATDSNADGGSSPLAVDTGQIENLMALLTYSATTPAAEEYTSDHIVTSGTVLFLNNNYTFSEGVTLTVEDGAAIAYCPLQPFSFVGTNMFLDMEEGSVFAIVSDKPADFGELEDVAITMNETENDSLYKFNGTITNTASKLSPTDKIGFTLTMGKGSVISELIDGDKTKIDSTTTFNEDNKVAVNLEKFVLAPTPNVDVSINVAVDATNNNLRSSAKIDIKGAPSYTVNASVADNTLTAKITGNGEITGELYKTDTTPEQKLATFTYSNSIDANARITDYGDETKAKMYFDGSADVSIEVTDIYYEEIEEGVTVMVGELSGVYANMSMGFRNDTVTISAEAGLGYFAMSDNNGGTTDLMKRMEIEDINASIEYRVKSADPLAVALAKPSIGSGSLAAAPNPSDVIKGLAKAYFDGMPEGDFDVRSYAKEFFFGQVGGYLPVSTDEMVNDYLYADFSIGSIFATGKIDAAGINGSLEISDSVGARVEANIGKLYTYDKNETTMIQPVNITIQTSGDKTKFLELDAYATGEVKSYYQGMLENDFYVDGLNINASVNKNDKVAAGVDYALNDLSIKRLGTSSDGVYMVINDASYNDELKQIEAGTVSISGDYYGGAPILSIDGTIRDVVMPFDINSIALDAPVSTAPKLTIGSADFTVYDLYGSSLRITRDYDAAKATINDRFSADGQIWFGDVFHPASPVNQLFKLQFTNQAATVKTNVEIDGVLIINGTYFQPEVGDPVVQPSFTLTAADGLKIFNGGITPAYSANSFVGAIYVSPMQSNGNSLGSAPATVFADDLIVRTYGSSIGVFVDSAGNVSYELQATPEYRLDVETGNPVGFTIDSSNDDSAKITRTGTELSFNATPRTFNVIIDGKTVKEDAKYHESISVTDVTASFLFDKNGAIIGTVDPIEKEWTYTRHRGTGDLELTSVTFKPYTGEIKSGVTNPVDDDSVQFTFGDVSGKFSFRLNNGVRFDVTGANGKEVQFVAKETTFNGNKAFVIKALTNSGVSLPTTLYIPVGGEGQKIMHVDEYGRANEYKSTYKVIDGQAYQVLSVSNYSIFYATDDVPNFAGSGDGKNNNLLYIGIAVVVAIVALAGVAYFLKTKQSAA